jgi:hypothetical protein
MTEPAVCDGQLDLLGDALKQDGMARAEASTDPWWRSCAMTALETEAKTGRVFQSYDLVLRYGLDEPPSGPNAWGSLLGAAARAGLIEAVGYAPSNRPTTAKSAVRTWRGVAA